MASIFWAWELFENFAFGHVFNETQKCLDLAAFVPHWYRAIAHRDNPVISSREGGKPDIDVASRNARPASRRRHRHRLETRQLARSTRNLLEIVESCKIIEQVLDRMPEGTIHAGEIYSVPAGDAVVRIEAPHGEVFYYIASDGGDAPVRVKVWTLSDE
jgi:coenzyme F420-reducing hydrogenase alpha subunit